jgi:hypothetical protein
MEIQASLQTTMQARKTSGVTSRTKDATLYARLDRATEDV